MLCSAPHSDRTPTGGRSNEVELIAIGVLAVGLIVAAVVLRTALRQLTEAQLQLRQTLPNAIAEAVVAQTAKRLEPAEQALHKVSASSARVSEALVQRNRDLSKALVTPQWGWGAQRVGYRFPGDGATGPAGGCLRRATLRDSRVVTPVGRQAGHPVGGTTRRGAESVYGVLGPRPGTSG